MPVDGTILFARYAFMPNRLSYCGGADNRALFNYCVAGQTDPGLVPILQKFQAAYPYLKLIATSNHIPDPFDARVVEAYWVGNELLDGVDLSRLYHSLHDRFAKRLDPKTLGKVTENRKREGRGRPSRGNSGEDIDQGSGHPVSGLNDLGVHGNAVFVDLEVDHIFGKVVVRGISGDACRRFIEPSQMGLNARASPVDALDHGTAPWINYRNSWNRI